MSVASSAIPANQNCTRFDIYKSQLCGLILIPITISATAAQLCGLVGNSGNGAGRYLTGAGSVSTEKITAKGRGYEFISHRIYSLQFEVYNMSDMQRNFLLNLQGDRLDFALFYETLGGRLFGPITPGSTDANMPLLVNRQSHENGQLFIQWSNKTEPKRTVSPDFDKCEEPALLFWGLAADGVWLTNADSGYQIS